MIREKHFPALDGLRGLAALMIVAHHSAASYILTNNFDKAYLRLTSWLWAGVDLFFVLSGFLITNILLDTRGSRGYFKTFYGRRFVRIFPLYFAYLTVLYFVLPLLGVPLSLSLVKIKYWIWTYTLNIYNCFFFWQDVNTNHFWTLAIEEQFYFLWPLIIFLLNDKRLKNWSIAAFLSLPLLRWSCLEFGLTSHFIYYFLLCHCDGLLLGGLISILLYRTNSETWELPNIRKGLRLMDWALSALTLAFFIEYYYVLGNHDFIFNMADWSIFGQCTGGTFISLYFAYIIFRAVSIIPNALQRVLNFKYFRMIGKYSYALYVLHAPICYWVGSNLPVPRFLQNLSTQWSFLHSVYLIAMDFVLSITASIISWNLLEKHFLKLKKYFPYHSGPQEFASDARPLVEFINT